MNTYPTILLCVSKMSTFIKNKTNIRLIIIACCMVNSVRSPENSTSHIRDYSLTFGKKQYEKDTIFGDANSHHSSVA